MELRVLRYFLAVAREESITRAAEALHLSQPTLSRQLRDLEEELGKELLIRQPRRVLLTEDGMILRKRAEEILSLVEKAESEIRTDGEALAGDIYIGAGETKGAHVLTRTAARLQARHPNLRFHMFSGDTVNVVEQLDKGLIDFGLIFDPVDYTKYQVLPLPEQDTWGVLMRADSPLAAKESVTVEDLRGLPLILSRQSLDNDTLADWFGTPLARLPVAATYNLAYNASLMVADGMGYALCLDRIISAEVGALAFRPLDPPKRAGMSVIWKKYQVFSRASECFLAALREELR